MPRFGSGFRKAVAEKSSGTPADLLVVGLGNPGDEYAHTRHNAGWDVVAELASRHNLVFKRARGKALWAHTRIDEKLLALGIPGTYMNLSGEGVVSLIRRYGIDDLARLVIVHDEVDIPPGRIHIKLGGGLAGHNGLKSIKHHVHSDEFVRVRVGVGRPAQEGHPIADYVLRKPSGEERATLAGAIEEAANAIEVILASDIVTAMNRFNGK